MGGLIPTVGTRHGKPMRLGPQHLPPLAEWEISELLERARLIRERHQFHSYRRLSRECCAGNTLRNLAREYGITERTLYRYLNRYQEAA